MEALGLTATTPAEGTVAAPRGPNAPLVVKDFFRQPQ
jgi:hypothetical protein